MKYLFFDQEFASQKDGISKICEFGYVVTDEKFTIIEKDNIIINPNIYRFEWDYRVLRTILTRRIKEYEESDTFDKHYNKICELIKSADYVFGHSLDGDAKALNGECKRYNFSSIDFVFYDVKLFYKSFRNTKRDVSVANIMADLNVQGDEKEHDAGADAYNTMLELKAMLDELKMSLEDLIQLCPEARNKNENYEVESIVINNLIRQERFENLGKDGESNGLKRGTSNGILFVQFLDNVIPNKKCPQLLKDEKISISINYEENHFKQMLNLVQLICNYGGKYVMKASQGTIFISYPVYNEDGTEKNCSKLKYVKEANGNGANIKIMDLKGFLKILDMSEKELDELPMVDFDCLCREGAIIKNRKTVSMVKAKKGADNSKSIQNNKVDKFSTLGELYGDYFTKYGNEDVNNN